MSTSSSDAINQILGKLLNEPDSLIAEYLLTDQAFFEHADDVIYDEIDAGVKIAYTRKFDDITKKRDEVVMKFQKVNKQIDTTWEIIEAP